MKTNIYFVFEYNGQWSYELQIFYLHLIVGHFRTLIFLTFTAGVTKLPPF